MVLDQKALDRLARDRVEGDPLAARPDGRQKRLGHRRGEDDDRAGRRLLERLEHLVLRLDVQAVGVDEHEDLPAPLVRLERRGLEELGHLLDADHAHRARRPKPEHVGMRPVVDLAAGKARVARRGPALFAVEGLGELARDQPLADARRPGEQVGVRDSALLDAAREQLDRALVAYDRLEAHLRSSRLVTIFLISVSSS